VFLCVVWDILDRLLLVEIGKSLWQTSIFPDSKSGSYLLPVKKAVRLKEGLVEGKSVSVAITLRV
jgi:hypothetical protein